MKKFTLIILILIFLLGSSYSEAGDFSLDAKPQIFVPLNDGIQQGQGLQVSAMYKNYYLWGSWISTERRISGQRAGNIDLWAAGFGIQTKISKSLSAWVQIGYYFPQHKGMNGHGSDAAEPLWLYWKNWGAEHNYDVSPYQYFKQKISGNVGGALGINLREEIMDDLWIGIDAGYQVLKLREQFWAGENSDFFHHYIETREDKNFSGALLGIVIQYNF